MGDLGVHSVSASGFSLQVDDYEQGRPSYPQQAVGHALQGLWHGGDSSPKAVLDVAAGTGKFTRLLAEHPLLAVTALEPNEGMRKGFEEAQTRWNLTRPISCHPGNATALPFDDASFDAVTVAQAFHWFANETALREMHRVLRPQGLLVLLWNREDEDVPWQKQLLHFFEPLSTGVPQYWQGTWKQAFDNQFAREKLGVTDIEQHRTVFKHTVQCTRAQLRARFRSRSYIAVLPPDEQGAVLKQLDDLLDAQASSFHASTVVSGEPGWEVEQAAKGPPVIDVVLCTEVAVFRAV